MRHYRAIFSSGILAIRMGVVLTACGNTQSRQVTSETHTQTNNTTSADTSEQPNSNGQPSQPVVTVADNTPPEDTLPNELTITATYDGEPKSSVFYTRPKFKDSRSSSPTYPYRNGQTQA